MWWPLFSINKTSIFIYIHIIIFIHIPILHVHILVFILIFMFIQTIGNIPLIIIFVYFYVKIYYVKNIILIMFKCWKNVMRNVKWNACWGQESFSSLQSTVELRKVKKLLPPTIESRIKLSLSLRVISTENIIFFQ